MSILGPIVDALAGQLEPEASGNAETNNEETTLSERHVDERQARKSGVTHKWALKKTQLIEADYTVTKEKQSDKEEEETKSSKERKSCGCSCFGLFRPKAGN